MTLTADALTADTLLEGPRGRRLVLEWLNARSGDGAEYQRLREVLFDAAYVQGRDRGHAISIVSYGQRVSRLERSTTPPAAVAEALDALPCSPPPTAGELRNALRASVDAARYWQDPDGEDHVAADPAVRRALRRFASVLLDSSAATGWSDDVRRSEQVTVQWFEEGGARAEGLAPDARPAAELLVAWRAATIEDDLRARRERPDDPTAHYSGAWWSIPPHGLTRSTGLRVDGRPLGVELVEDRFGWAVAEVRPVAVPDRLRVLEVRSADDWAALCRAHPLDVTGEKRHDWFHATGRDGRWVMPDWAAVAREVDGVHLTLEGYLRCAGRAIDVALTGALAGDAASMIAGWNPDETAWFSDEVSVVADPQRWAWSDHDGWTRTHESGRSGGARL